MDYGETSQTLFVRVRVGWREYTAESSAFFALVCLVSCL